MSIRLSAGSAAAEAARAAAVEVFARWEARCSLFDPESELSRVGRGELALPRTSIEVREAYALALRWRDATDGIFTPHRGDGLVDLNGVVKALAIEEAGREFDSAGVSPWAIDAGGDILVSTVPSAIVGGAGVVGAGVTDRPWPVGIVDPADRSALIARIDLDGTRRRAVATSGSAERGDHIWTAPGASPTPFVQVSVAAADLVTADVLATTIVAGGRPTLDEVADRHDVDVLAVLRDGGMLATPGWPRDRAAVTRESAVAPATSAREAER